MGRVWEVEGRLGFGQLDLKGLLLKAWQVRDQQQAICASPRVGAAAPQPGVSCGGGGGIFTGSFGSSMSLWEASSSPFVPRILVSKSQRPGLVLERNDG